ncbi:hypothetical protein IT411_01640 [Candidatus Peregrinibacteria bacterium]|nr:hypothetical protein [Candidatus Peregrinibacteria bacterium]
MESPQMHPIIAIVGPSGSGKTALINEIIKRHPDKIGIIKSLASRDRRGPEDDPFYTFVPAQDIIDRKARGDLVQYLDFAGNIYGTDRYDVESIINHIFGIQAYVQGAIFALREAGYEVIPIELIPKNSKTIIRGNDTERSKADQERAKITLDYRLTIENDFNPGGFEKSLNQLEDFLLKQLLPKYPVK